MNQVKNSQRAASTYVAVNEPMYDYAAGSKERQELDAAIDKYSNKLEDIPIVIGGEEIRTKDVRYQVEPFDHQKKIASFYYATPELVQKAIDSSMKVRKDWEKRSLNDRCDIFLKAADLVSGKYRMDLMAATMLGQAKNVVQAEIDTAAEMADFLRFNVQFAQEITQYQPISPNRNVTENRTVYRGMEGFWAAITPFNFTAIGGHLPSAPVQMGNVCLWKPSDTAMLSNYIMFKIYQEAGLPPGVINFVPAHGPVFGDTITSSPHLAGINFTGSVATFKHLWKQVAKNLDIYKCYPRLIGECGGKNFHFIHKTADVQSVVNGTVRSAFEYSGQKCSACSRMYIPKSVWAKVKDDMIKIQKDIKVGSPLEKETFVSAVIDDKSFARIKGYLDHVKSSSSLKVLAGGKCDDSKGYFVEPTIIETSDPKEKMMQEEIFGPILTVYPYPDDQYKETAQLVTETSPFALTGAIYSSDVLMCILPVQSTNDKAGGPHYLLKFVSVQSVKETKTPMTDWTYPSMK
ncbi:hypothetical protein KUTeg_002309 [Tegillarca granosa]|uniref:Multifunctional fusion protein n=1 Tax=Tegillarca granosa TaxID=220873 RepID=A0ABQ9FTZ2_TEGGR|nr:hypothetical protein KUTeg_002309 [Tegillarca granosa]